MPDKMFLKILKSALNGNRISVDRTTDVTDWQSIFELAERHRVLPLIFDCVYSSFPHDPKYLESIRQLSRLLVTQQAVKSQSFLDTYRKLSASGLEPVTVKGIICRSLYPNPDLRISSDEDIFVSSAESKQYAKALEAEGFSLANPTENDGRDELTYTNQSGLRIELHRALFSSEDYFFSWNSFFEEALSRAVYVDVEGTKIKALSNDDHLLYLILHAVKHFLHSGIGIRQLCDITMFANTYGYCIDWDMLFSGCEAFGVLKFAAAVFAIGRNHLNLDPVKANFSEKWQSISVDEVPLLKDILSAGVYGSANLSRMHSSSITLNAAKGKKSKIIRNIFPSAKSLGDRYSYAKKHPVLTPVAWSHRIINYSRKISKKDSNTPWESYKIGKERIDLLNKYGLLNSSKS